MNKNLNGITLLTPSGDVLTCIERLIYYINKQEFPSVPIQWIISEDSAKEDYTPALKTIDSLIEVKHIHRKWCGKKAKSFTGNLLEAIPHIKYNHIMILESDDWYASNYLEQTLLRLQNFDLVGEPYAVYYNVATQRYKVHGNNKRASLCQTAFTDTLLEKFKKACAINRTSAFVDARFWKWADDRNWKRQLFQDVRLCIGIKGMPGRKGIGVGHRMAGGKKDPNYNKLRGFIGADAEFYKQYRQC